jgi:hypothetical protein
MMPLIENQIQRSSITAPVSMQEAAIKLCETGVSLTPSQHNGLKGLVKLLDDFKSAIMSQPLPELIKYIWKESGLENFHR